MKNARIPIIILAVLLLLALVAIGYFWNKNQNLQSSNQELNEELTILEEVRQGLLTDINDLQVNIDNLEVSNDTLQDELQEALATLESKQAEIQKLSKNYNRDISSMRQEIKQLLEIKEELTAVIEELRAENIILNDSLNVVSTENLNLEGEVTTLQYSQKNLEKELKATKAQSARVDNFRIDLVKKKGDVTRNFKRADEIVFSFEVDNIPPNMLGEHTVYLTINDAQGTPLPVANPVKATIRPNTGGQPIQIIAQLTKEAELVNGERLEMVYPITSKLDKGTYKAAVYVDWAMLGATEFNLQ